MDETKLIVVHFDEVALKGGRRRYFVRKLIRNIYGYSPVLAEVRARSLYDRILLGPLSDEEFAAAQDLLAVMPGVAWFSPVRRLPPAVESLPEIAAEYPGSHAYRTFAVRTRRPKKDFPMTSMDVNRELGRMIQERSGWPVDLEKPDLTVRVDVTPQGILTYSSKRYGPGGLPVGSSGKLICLLSGGIDSPVAAYKMMCRGCRMVFVHFHNFGPQSRNVRDKLVRIVEQLSRYQGTSRLYLVPFAEVQSELVAAVPPRMRMVAYRRAMLKLAAPVVEAEHARGIVVGDSVGQVASQTLENLQATWCAAKSPVLAPLIGEGKKATMDLARRIGTYEPSILPYEDCCQLLVAKSPETRCTAQEMAAFEERLDLERHLESLIENAEVLDISPATAPIEATAQH